MQWNDMNEPINIKLQIPISTMGAGDKENQSLCRDYLTKLVMEVNKTYLLWSLIKVAAWHMAILQY